MTTKHNRIAVVPIRKGSSRFPDKNIFDIAGVPLFAFAAHEAKISGVFDSVCIASDSEHYLEIAEAFGFDVFLRSAQTSDHMSPSEAVLIEVGESLKLAVADALFLIQATSPFQRAKYFVQAMELLATYESVITVEPMKRFFLSEVVDGDRVMTQNLSERLLETGLFWGMRYGSLIERRDRIGKTYGLVRVDASDTLDIDYFSDLEKYIPFLERKALEISGKARI